MKRLTLILSLLFLSAASHAEGWFAGGSVGFAEAEWNQRFLTPAGDDTLLALKGFGGYRVNDYLAVEGSLGGAANDEDGTADATFAALTGSLLGIAPISDAFEIFLRGGFYLGESEVGFADSEDESGFLAGTGVFVNIGTRRQFTIRLEYEYYDVDELDDLWTVTGGFQYNFE